MPRAGLTKELIALAGADLADELGFEQVTLSALARHFDVATASLYSHISSSHDLKNRIATFALNESADQLAKDIAGRSGKSALVALAESYRDYSQEHPGRFNSMTYHIAAEDDSIRAGLRHAELAHAVLRGYDLPDAEHVHAVRFIGATIRGFISFESKGAFNHRPPQTITSWTRCLDALDAALRVWPKDTT